MSYLVIARKYRPQTFASIVGQDHITIALGNAILRNRVPHALLLTGPRGVGKTTSARVFAKALNCTGRALTQCGNGEDLLSSASDPRLLVEPCGHCANCDEISKSSSMAVWEIDGASHNGVDSVRELIDSLRTLPPPGSNYKIYIIDEVHMLSTAAFNALLKSLEEPPPNTIFIFATTEPHKIPATVISRCQRHDFRRVPDAVIVSALRAIATDQRVEVHDDVLWFIARKSFGGMRDAQSSFDRLISFSVGHINLEMAEAVFGVVGRGFFFELSKAVLEHSTERCFLLLDQVFKGSVDLRSFLSDYLMHWRNLLLVKISDETKGASLAQAEMGSLSALCDFSSEETKTALSQVQGFSSFDLQRLFELAEKSAQSALTSIYPRYLLEAGLARMASHVPIRPLSEVVIQLENWLKSGTSTLPAAKNTTSSQIAHRTEPLKDSKTTTTHVELTELAENQELSFNPSWEEFVNFVKQNNQVLLSSYLRRVSVDIFQPGKLTIRGSDFDISSLRDPDLLSSLKANLESYAKTHLGENSQATDLIKSWSISFEEGKIALSPNQNTKQSSPKYNKGASANQRRTEGPADYLAGSIAQQEKESEQSLHSMLEEESRNDPAVKAALSVFKGGTIERVNISKK